MNENFVMCGTLKVSAGHSDIVCDIKTGDLVFCDDVMGSCLMSNMAVTDPIDCEGKDEVLNNILKSTEADGVIMSETYLITLKDGVAEYRDYKNGMEVLHTVNYDLDIEYDFNE